jgi:hypothetical protein
LGRYVKDTEAAADWMCRELGVNRVVVGGLCGGAITGLLAGCHPRVAALIGLGLPVSVDGSNVDKVRFMSAGQLEGIRTKYFRKLLDPGSWGRLLSFKTDYRLLVRALLTPLQKRRQQNRKNRADNPPVLNDPGNTNPYFRPAVLRMASMNRPLLLVFSETDRLYSEFQERFVDTHAIDVNALRSVLDVQVVPLANHIFTFREWQSDMLGRVRDWMNTHFPNDTQMSAMSRDRARAVGQ